LDRLNQIKKYTSEDLIDVFSKVYSENYLRSCRGINWNFPLNLLQLCAICIGGLGLSTICKAYAINYRHFGAGFPDLLMIRVSFRKSTNVISNCDKTDDSNQYIDIGNFLEAGWAELSNIDENAVTDSISLLDVEGMELLKNSESEHIFEGITNPNLQNLNFASIIEKNDILKLNNLEENFKFEVLFVEVKGPTDHLAYKQNLWLQILSSNCAAAVCFLKEE
jgi:hypothetical protein